MYNTDCEHLYIKPILHWYVQYWLWTSFHQAHTPLVCTILIVNIFISSPYSIGMYNTDCENLNIKPILHWFVQYWLWTSLHQAHTPLLCTILIVNIFTSSPYSIGMYNTDCEYLYIKPIMHWYVLYWLCG